MNKSYENIRMSVKSSNRNSLVPSDTKRAAKTISCMRNGKVNSSPTKVDSLVEDEKKTLVMKQEPEDECYFDENELLPEDEDDEEQQQHQQQQEPQQHQQPQHQLQQQQSSTGMLTAGSGMSTSRISYPLHTRVRSHARSLRAMANPSAVWAHFDLCSNDPLRAQCRLCGAVVVRGGANPRQCGTTNLHRHLRVHHGGRLVGRRYHVMSEFVKREQEQLLHTTKTLRQGLVRRMRNIAPAPSPAAQQQQQQQQQSQQHHPKIQAQPQQQQQHQPQLQPLQPKQTKTLVLKTIPLKLKQISPTTIKMPALRQGVQGIQQVLPQIILPQPPTEVCLRWNSYHSNMQHSFPSLLDSEEFVDVTLACEGRSLKCHKMILSSCSDYLAQLLRENPCQHPIILMKDLKFWEVEALVKFMYRGEVNVTHDKLPQLLNAAEALQVKGLAGPSNSQNPKPPLLIPQAKNGASVPGQSTTKQQQHQQKQQQQQQAASKEGVSKEKPTTSTATIPNILLSSKRGQKRRCSSSAMSSEDPLEARPFTKIRLQRPTTATSTAAQPLRRKSSSPTTVKSEPVEPAPFSPVDHRTGEQRFVYHSDHRESRTAHEDDADDADEPSYENLLGIHADADPGGNDIELLAELAQDEDSRNAYSEDQMEEFVPTDFLEQEQNIGDDSESQANSTEIQYDEDDSKLNNEDEEDEDAEIQEEDEEEEKIEQDSRPNRTKKDKT